MESFRDGFWEAIGVEAWKYAPNPVEAVQAYLSVVPVACRSHLPTILQQEITSDTVAQLQRRGITRVDRGFGAFERGKLLWSRNYLQRAKGEWTRLATDPVHIYHRAGWNPVLGPLVLHGAGVLAGLEKRPSVLLFGSDLVRWANTFCAPNQPLPEAWCCESLGTGAGMLLIPSDDPAQPEEWCFFIQAHCHLAVNLVNLISEIEPMLSSRLLNGKRVKLTFLLGFNSDLSPGHPTSMKRWRACHSWSSHELQSLLRLGISDWISVGVIMVVCLRETPCLWRFYQCRDVKKRDWSFGVYPFAPRTRTGDIKTSPKRVKTQLGS